MSRLMISDLTTSRELDNKAMTAVFGGKRSKGMMGHPLHKGSVVIGSPFTWTEVNTDIDVALTADVDVTSINFGSGSSTAFAVVGQSPMIGLPMMGM